MWDGVLDGVERDRGAVWEGVRVQAGNGIRGKG